MKRNKQGVRRFQAPSQGGVKTHSRNKKSKQEIDLKSFIKSTNNQEVQSNTSLPEEIRDLPLDSILKANLVAKGFRNLTEIQSASLKPLMDGRDLVGIAQTGTGKTAAFLMPIIHKLVTKPVLNSVLIILPTRELALQVDLEFKNLSKGMNLYSGCFVGGLSVNNDVHNLQDGVHVVIGTPGRLQDLQKRNAIRFNWFQTLVLDEFDRLLDMGFLKDIQRMIGQMTNRDQSILFSATEDKSQEKIIQNILKNPVKVSVHAHQQIGTQIQQELIPIEASEDRFVALKSMLGKDDLTKVLVFADTKRMVSRLCKKLNQQGFPSEQIHGDRSQNQRIKALKSFEDGNVRILLATDVAARGLHITDVSHVINYQTPKNLDSYIHRVGRTGRAGKIGTAYTFISA